MQGPVMAKFAFTLSEVRVLIEAPDANEALNKVDELAGYFDQGAGPEDVNFLIRGWSGMAEPLRTCAVCGCTDDDACEQGCSWMSENLCDTDDDAHYKIALAQGVAQEVA